MIGMGLTFSAGVFVVASTLAALAWLLQGGHGDRETIIVVVGSSVWSFLIGVAFSGFLMLAARGRPFEKLSLPLFATLGAGGGLLLYGVLALNAWSAWSATSAMVNLVLFLILGSGSATATLLLARKSARGLERSDESRRLGEG
jgi:hypothetical protein